MPVRTGFDRVGTSRPTKGCCDSPRRSGKSTLRSGVGASPEPLRRLVRAPAGRSQRTEDAGPLQRFGPRGLGTTGLAGFVPLLYKCQIPALELGRLPRLNQSRELCRRVDLVVVPAFGERG